MSPGEPWLGVDVGGLALRNPVLAASGTCGYGVDLAPYLDLARLGGVVVKGLSLLPREGNPPPRICETPAGMLNAIGVANVGIDAFLAEKLPELRRYDTRVVVNLHAEIADDFAELARRCDAADGVDAVEVNVSCPNVARGGLLFGQDPRATAEVTRAVVENTRKPVIVKLSPNVTDIVEIGRAAADAGARALSAINTLRGMAVDLETRRPVLANVAGGLSGPCIKPVGLFHVYRLVRELGVPVIAVGGIMTARDALEYIIVGAHAVQVGTASLLDPGAAQRVADGIADYLRAEGIASLDELRGALRAPGAAAERRGDAWPRGTR